jgi:hypothetical protein
MSAAAAIATPTPTPPAPSVFDQVVAIYQLAREFELWLWLCPRCLAARMSIGWAIRVRKLPPPRELLVFLGPDAFCSAVLDDRTNLPCTDCATT